MAETDAGRMAKYKPIIKRVGAKHGIDPALIAAIISRESRAGNTIAHTGGRGDNGKAFGLMQVVKTSAVSLHMSLTQQKFGFK